MCKRKEVKEMTIKEISKMKKKERIEKRQALSLKKKRLDVVATSIEAFDKLVALSSTVFSAIKEAGQVIVNGSLFGSLDIADVFVLSSITLIVTGTIISTFIKLKAAQVENDIESIDRVIAAEEEKK